MSEPIELGSRSTSDGASRGSSIGPLSLGRVTSGQIERLIERATDGGGTADFD
jgi:hypothetical protein